MALNPYFQQGATSEQNLVQDLINEQLKIYGIEVYYLPRQYVTKNTVIKEVIESKFTDAYPIEAYVCLLYTSPSPRDQRGSRMPSSA